MCITAIGSYEETSFGQCEWPPPECCVVDCYNSCSYTVPENFSILTIPPRVSSTVFSPTAATQPAFSLEKAKKNIQTICGVSPNIEPYSLTSNHKKTSVYAERRAKVFVKHMKKLGFEVTKQSLNGRIMEDGTPAPMDAYNYVATYYGEEGAPEIWFLGHHDYNAAQGASDNATSLGIQMELARLVAMVKPKYTVRFATFAFEETGMWGSWYFVDHWDLKNDKIKAVINMDCVGAGKDPVIATQVESVVSSKTLMERLLQISEELGYKDFIKTADGSSFFSDHVTFAKKGITELIELMSLDKEYHVENINHTPNDVCEKLRWDQVEAVGKISFSYILAPDSAP